jgi:hypothetical protein
VTSEQLTAVDISLSRLEWTLYAMNLFVGLALEQVRLFDRPSRAKPIGRNDSGSTCEGHGEWTPYPVPYTPVPFHHDCHYDAFVTLADIVTSDEALYESKRRSDTRLVAAAFGKLYAKVKEWPETIKSCMRLHDEAVPHVIALQ